jgi:hypothetical protein
MKLTPANIQLKGGIPVKMDAEKFRNFAYTASQFKISKISKYY